MSPSIRTAALTAMLVACALPAAGADDAAALAELKRQLAAQQAEIDALAAKIAQQEEAAKAEPKPAAEPELAGSSHFGGYGELHYNNLDSGSEMDFHRFVLFFSHQFDDGLRFFSEVELEHAVAEDGANGAFELEQAYVEMNLDDDNWVTAGVFLLPVGILNQKHEPTEFYGVERNPVETRIIPSTWREGGLALSGRFGGSGLGYDLALTSGLNMDSTFTVRDSRQHVSEAIADELATTARVKYTGVPGLELAASITYQSDVSQGLVVGAGAGTLVATHATYDRGAFSARALYAVWSLEGSAPAAIGKDQQDGSYVEAAWRFVPTFGVFARYNQWDEGGVGATGKTQADIGFNWWPHRQVVVKLDVQDQGDAANDDGFSLGIGYRF